MRDSRDIDAFVWDDALVPADATPQNASPVSDRDQRMPDSSAMRSMVALGALLVTVIAGTVVTHSDGGGLGPDVLYAAAIHLALIAVLPRVDPFVHGAAVLVWCTGIELLQITGLPAIWAVHVPLCRLVLGTGYDPVDLAAYALGVVAVLIGDRTLSSLIGTGGAGRAR